MEKVLTFSNSEFGKLNVTIINDKEYFPATRCAEILGYSNPQKAIRDHCKGVNETCTPTQGGNQTIKVIPESDIYRLIVKAADQSMSEVIKQKAERFERWVFDEVLPSIRKHGAYVTSDKLEEIMNDPDAWIKLLTTLKTERQEKEKLRLQTEQDKPKVLFADAVAASEGTILIGELAKVLKGNGAEMGQNRLYEWLRQNGYLISRKGTDYNMPTQMAMELGLFKIKENAISSPNGQIIVSKTSYVTGKGQQYFINKFIKECVNK